MLKQTDFRTFYHDEIEKEFVQYTFWCIKFEKYM